MPNRNYGFYNVRYKIVEGDIIGTYKNTCKSIKITLDDNTYFICGINNLIFDVDNHQIEAQHLIENQTILSDGSKVISKELLGEMLLDDIDVSNEENSLYILFDNHEIKVHNLPSIAGYIIGGNTDELGQDVSQTGSVSYTTSYTSTDGIYNNVIIKKADGTRKYVHKPYILSTKTTYGVTSKVWKPVDKGYIFTNDGARLWWDQPKGIPGLLNVAMLSSSPFTMVIAKWNNNYTKANLIKLNPDGLSDLSKILKIQIAGSYKYRSGRIIIAGINTDSKYAVWECNTDEDYHFDKIWEDNVICNTSITNADITSKWIYNSTSDYSRYLITNIKFFRTPDSTSATSNKVVQLCYDYDLDTYFNNVTVVNSYAYLHYIEGACSCFFGAGGVVQNQYRWNNITNNNPSATYSTKALSGAQLYTNRFVGSLSNMFLSCTYTPSGGNTSGYIFRTLDNGNSFTQIAGGNNTYRIMKRNPEGYFWGVGYSNQNFIQSIWVPSTTNYYTSKITFPTTTLYSNRIQIPGTAFVLAGSSTVYTFSYDSMAGGTDQTVSTTTLTDENGSEFVASNASWNVNNCDGNMAFNLSHTFYINSNTGYLLSETRTTTGNFIKESIYLGTNVSLPRAN